MPKVIIPKTGQASVILKNRQDEITIDGKKYVSTLKYAEHLGGAAYYASELQKARRDGLPHIEATVRGKKAYFYSIEDCEIWHMGTA